MKKSGMFRGLILIIQFGTDPEQNPDQKWGFQGFFQQLYGNKQATNL